ncbi:MAG: glycolate oxidase subunit GlcF [SAR324 cluster bacterium]|nr:glycolate oxidase subunit GlcF [SAR324 cluster bacterium]
MQTAIAPEMLQNPEVRVSERILRACVHCGFCNATCPTYLLSGSEMEGPRGRIYLIKSVLEESIDLTGTVVEHLDNCLSCFACMTTCPSGVNYSHLIDEARDRIETHYRRPLMERLLRAILAHTLPYPGRFRVATRLNVLAKPLAALFPSALRALIELAPAKLPPPSRLARPGVVPATGRRRARVALLTGCAQTVLAPQINDATIRLLTRIGCEVVIPPGMGCCGALVYHMGNRPGSLPHMMRNIETWHSEMEGEGLDYIVINTSGCGTVVKDYGHIFKNDPDYAQRAGRVAGITRDVSEVVDELGLGELAAMGTIASGLRVAYHDACSLQHGQQVRRQPRALLRQAGFEVLDIPDGHLCCGSAGTYNALKPATAAELGRQKAAHIAGTRPDVIAAGNIGCMEQIARFSAMPVVHTAELLDWATGGPQPAGLNRSSQ